MTPSASFCTDSFALSAKHATPVRLACVKHAASVRPEPGSNPQFKSLLLQVSLFSSLIVCPSLLLKVFELTDSFAFLHCSIFNVHFRFLTRTAALLSQPRLYHALWALYWRQLLYIITPSLVCQAPKNNFFYVNFSQLKNIILIVFSFSKEWLYNRKVSMRCNIGSVSAYILYIWKYNK